MKAWPLLIQSAVVVVSGVAVGAAAGQHDTHAAPIQAVGGQSASCPQGAKDALSIAERRRSTTGSSSNVELRRRVARLRQTVDAVTDSLRPCTTGPVAGEAPAPAAQRGPAVARKRAPSASEKLPVAADPAPMAMDHSKMEMGATDPGSMTKGDPKLPYMPAERVMDPACPTADFAAAPKAVFNRRIYYFCSPQDRDEFRKDPAGYLKKHPRG